MADEVFADRMTEILQIGSTVRINLESLASEQPRQGQGTAPAYVTRQRVVMPIEGFLQSFAVMEKLVAQLLSAGIISRESGSPLETAVPSNLKPLSENGLVVAEPPDDQATGPISPNFPR